MVLSGISPPITSLIWSLVGVMTRRWVMKFLLLIILALVMDGCAKRELSLDELEDVIPGSYGIETESMQYVFEGNHAGYFIVLQSRASKESVETLISSSDHETEPFLIEFVSDYRELFHRRFKDLRVDAIPNWFQFEPSADSQKFRLRGSNNWTSEFLYDGFYDPISETLWLEGGGI